MIDKFWCVFIPHSVHAHAHCMVSLCVKFVQRSNAAGWATGSAFRQSEIL